MQLMFGVVSYIFILFGMYHRSVISFILAPLSIAMLFFHYKEYKVITVVLMLLQGLLTAFMVYLRMQGNTVNTANQSSVYIRVGEICQLLDISEPTAYKVMHKLNKELAAMGYITLAGRTNRAYFMQKVCGYPAVAEGGV